MQRKLCLYSLFMKVVVISLFLDIGFSFTSLSNSWKYTTGKSKYQTSFKTKGDAESFALVLKIPNAFELSARKIICNSNLQRSEKEVEIKEKNKLLRSRKDHVQKALLGVGLGLILKVPTIYPGDYIANAVQDPKRNVWISGKSIKEKGDKDRTGTKKDIKYLRCLSNCTSDCKKPGASIDTSDNQSCLEQCQDQCCETYEQCTYQLQRE